MKPVRHFLELLFAKTVFGVLWLLPMTWSIRFCGFLMQVIGMRLRRTTHAANLMCSLFDGMTLAQARSHLRFMWRNLGWMLGEIPHLSSIHRNPEKFLRSFRVFGNMPEDGETTYILTAHYGDWEILPAFYVLRQKREIKANILYSPPGNKRMVAFFQKMRTHGNVRSIPITNAIVGTRVMRSLHAKECVGSLFDQRSVAGKIPMKFLGKPLLLDTHTLGIIVRTKTPLFLFRCTFDGGPTRHKLEVFGPYLFDDPVLGILYCNALLEQWIKEDPKQWFFVHNRWERW